MQEMHIYGVSFDIVGKQPIVLLKTAEWNKFLPIWIGHPEAAAILMKLQGASTPRPMTHDLLTAMLGELDARVLAEVRHPRFHRPRGDVAFRAGAAEDKHDVHARTASANRSSPATRLPLMTSAMRARYG